MYGLVICNLINSLDKPAQWMDELFWGCDYENVNNRAE
jgi:hypothetical protein